MSNADDRHTQLKALAEGLLAIEGLCHVAAMVLNVRGEFNMWRERAQHIGKFAEQIDAIRFARLYERAAETAPSRPASAPSTDFRMSEIAQGAPAPTGASTGPQRGEKPTGATLAPDCRDMATVTSAPSSPRRWWLNVYPYNCVSVHSSHKGAQTCASDARVECVPVVEASAYDAAVMRATVAGEQARAWEATFDALNAVRPGFANIGASGMDSAVRAVRELAAERDAARAELAAMQEELRKMADVQNHNARLHALLDVNERTCHNCHRELTPTEQHWLECSTCFDEEDRKRLQGEVRLKDETIAQLRAELANARRLTPEVVERAAEAIAAKAGFAFEETNLLIDTRHIRGLARAALLAAGFQEVAG